MAMIEMTGALERCRWVISAVKYAETIRRKRQKVAAYVQNWMKNLKFVSEIMPPALCVLVSLGSSHE
jgi:hypothetical protein